MISGTLSKIRFISTQSTEFWINNILVNNTLDLRILNTWCNLECDVDVSRPLKEQWVIIKHILPLKWHILIEKYLVSDVYIGDSKVTDIKQLIHSLIKNSMILEEVKCTCDDNNFEIQTKSDSFPFDFISNMSILMQDVLLETCYISSIVSQKTQTIIYQNGGVFVYKNGQRKGFESSAVIDKNQNIIVQTNIDQYQHLFGREIVSKKDIVHFPLLTQIIYTSHTQQDLLNQITHFEILIQQPLNDNED